MAFLDNSGDIILDAVLTDTGRFRLAKGDGSFKIAKYAFADDEIDYAKYDLNHSSGSAYYDIDVLKTPVLEAFTNNTSTMKHRLISIPRTNLRFLPVTKLNEVTGLARNSDTAQANGMYVLAVNKTTEDKFTDNGLDTVGAGVMYGENPGNSQSRFISIDQGLNTDQISKDFTLDPDLVETRFIVELDNRLGSISKKDGTIRQPSFVDDDNVATYNFQHGVDTDMIESITKSDTDTPINGPRGNRFSFAVRSSLELNSSSFLFTKLGKSDQTWDGISGATFYVIDSVIRITGATTGYKIDIPIRFLRYQAG